jgi:hypothetical protein
VGIILYYAANEGVTTGALEFTIDDLLFGIEVVGIFCFGGNCGLAGKRVLSSAECLVLSWVVSGTAWA